MRTSTIDLGARSYRIHLGRDILKELPGIASSLKLPLPFAVVTDRNVASMHLRKLLKVLGVRRVPSSAVVIPPGERQKSLRRAEAITTALLESGYARSAPIAAFGGGVVGDVTGLVAALYRRGSPLIQIPTTLLAQVESAIGGKVGVNHALAKNAIGTFYQPRVVLSDVVLLETLPRREIICGLGEIAKYAILDAEILGFLEAHLDSIMALDPEVLEETIALCNVIKARLVSNDERETDPAGGRNVLNLGHRIGHALEHLSHFRLHHGEAVVVGLRLELEIAKEAGVVDPAGYENIKRLLDRIDYWPRLGFIRPAQVVSEIFGGKGRAAFVLPVSVGRVTSTGSIEPRLVLSVLKRGLVSKK